MADRTIPRRRAAALRTARTVLASAAGLSLYIYMAATLARAIMQ